MKQEIRDKMRAEVADFAAKLRAYEGGEIELKAFKGFSGGFGSYPQRSGGNMLRLRMAGGRLTKERLAFFAMGAEEYGVDRMKLTTCQTIQMHNLSARATVELMEKAVDVDIITRGGGGDHPRNTMASPLSGVEKGEYFDVLPWAEAVAEYLLARIGEIRMPRKLKVGFSNSPANVTHATFRDLGFVAREDGLFDVYCAGGLGPNPRVGVQVGEKAAPADLLAYVEAMIALFCQFGNYENRAKARTRYLQESMGADSLRAEFARALETALITAPKLAVEIPVVDKAGDGTITHPRVVEQKQEGLYAVWYHPKGGNLPPEKPGQLYQVIRDMPQVECRIDPKGTIYVINLTAREAEKVLEVTADSGVTPFQCSVSCIGGSICTTGTRDSQALLMAMLEAVEEAALPENALPTVHVSGCPSSCGTQQIGKLGFMGAGKIVDGQGCHAFQLTVNGRESQGEERFGKVLGVILATEVPNFIVELGRMVAASGMDFDTWLDGHGADFEALASKYTA